MTIDTDQNLWVAIYYGGVILKIARTGKILLEIHFDGLSVAGLAFGGENLDILYVATASKAFDIYHSGLANRTFTPESGSLYAVTGLNDNVKSLKAELIY